MICILSNLLSTIQYISYISFDNLQAATDFAISTVPDETIYLDDEVIDVGQWVARTFGMENKIPILIVNSRLHSEVQNDKTIGESVSFEPFEVNTCARLPI